MIIGKQANRVLRKEPAGKELKKKDKITINDAFQSRLHKVKIMTISKPVRFLMISRFTERILMEHIDSICSLDSQLCFDSICSVEILSRIRDIS